MADDPVTKLTNMIVLSAVKKRATAISIEAPSPTECAVFFVIDNAAVEELRPPHKLRFAIVARYAALAGIDLAALPGDGIVQMRLGIHNLFLAVRITLRAGLPEVRMQLTRPDARPRPLPS